MQAAPLDFFGRSGTQVCVKCAAESLLVNSPAPTASVSSLSPPPPFFAAVLCFFETEKKSRASTFASLLRVREEAGRELEGGISDDGGFRMMRVEFVDVWMALW